VVLEWARSAGCAWDAETFSAAARGGHLKILEWARSAGCEWSVVTCARAAEGGHLKVLQWLRAKGASGTSWLAAWRRAGGI